MKNGATATRRWSRQETKARAAAGPELRFARPTDAELDELVREYEAITGDSVRTGAKRNFLAACYRVHGDDFLPLARQTFGRSGTATNLLGALRETPPRAHGVDPGTWDSPETTHPAEPEAEGWRDLLQRDPNAYVTDETPNDESDADGPERTSLADGDSAWCGCREEELRPEVLYCASHRPEYLSFPKRQYDRRESNPAAARFFAVAAGPSAAESLHP